MEAPLAERIRPQALTDYISQTHLVGPNGSLTQQLKNGIIPSLLFWGPPGTGKTTLAQIIAQESKRPFYELSAINSGVKDIRDVIEKAKQSGGLFTAKNPILFIDEIHRFSKSQQDSLLAAVEKGWITLIGATTENPSFEVIPALLSRCQVYILNAFTKQDLESLLERAMQADAILASKKIELQETEALLRLSGGDGRKLLNIFELVVNASASEPIIITNERVLELVQQNTVLYDKTGEQHYDIVFYDCQELANINLTIENHENLHAEFVNDGIDTAVNHLLKKEKIPSHYLAFSMGGTIAYKAGILGLPIKSLYAISSTRVRFQKEIPSFSTKFLFG